MTEPVSMDPPSSVSDESLRRWMNSIPDTDRILALAGVHRAFNEIQFANILKDEADCSGCHRKLFDGVDKNGEGSLDRVLCLKCDPKPKVWARLISECLGDRGLVQFQEFLDGDDHGFYDEVTKIAVKLRPHLFVDFWAGTAAGKVEAPPVSEPDDEPQEPRSRDFATLALASAFVEGVEIVNDSSVHCRIPEFNPKTKRWEVVLEEEEG